MVLFRLESNLKLFKLSIFEVEDRIGYIYKKDFSLKFQ